MEDEKMNKIKRNEFNYNDIITKLEDEKKITTNKIRRKSLNIMIEITHFVFSDDVQDIIKEFDEKFNSKVGNNAYPRTMLLGIYLYSLSRDYLTVDEISNLCVWDDVLKIFTCKQTPSYSTLRRFLNNENGSDGFEFKNNKCYIV
jgi:hypothetical protein